MAHSPARSNAPRTSNHSSMLQESMNEERGILVTPKDAGT